MLTALFCMAGTLLGQGQRPDRSHGRKKVAVVLSGGGAKGMAHIGALRVIEKAGIPVDIITGTSMGSIVGGLYAIGYNASALDSLVRQQDWAFVLSDKEDLSMQSIAEREKQNTYMISRGIRLNKKGDAGDGGIIKGKNLHDLFGRLTSGYNDSIDFNKLPIPFACVATNIVDNTEYVFHSGYLAQAMRASMAIPAVFSPVRIGDMVLVDGGLRNNYPADIARQMGADIIIGVTVQGESKTADELRVATSIINQIIDVNCMNKYDENLSITNVPILVNTKGYTAASFTVSAIDTLIRRGEEAAMKHWDELMALKKTIGISDDFRPASIFPLRPRVMTEAVKVIQFDFQNMTDLDEVYLRRKFKLQEGDSLDHHQAELITTAMRQDLFYKDATYHFEPFGEEMRLVLKAGQKKDIQVNLGVRFDTEEIVALQLNASVPFRSKLPADLDLTLRLGRRIMGRADFALHPMAFSRMTLSYIFRRNELNVYEHGSKDFNITYNQHTVEFSPLNINVRNFNIRGGARYDHYDYHDLLIDHQVNRTRQQLADEHFYNYFLRVDYNSENNWYFPSRGSRFHSQYAYYTDNLTQLNHKVGMSDVSASWRMSFHLNSHLTLQPMAYGRLLFGSELPPVLTNVIGGEWFGHYVEQQLPFPGVGFIEKTDPHFVAIQLQAQQRINTSNYILLRLAAARHSQKFSELLDHKPLFGASLSYYYNLMFGPLGATFSYSGQTKKPTFYINLGFVF